MIVSTALYICLALVFGNQNSEGQTVSRRDKTYLVSDEYIDSINRNQRTWKAGRNFLRGLDIEDMKRRLGALKDPDPRNYKTKSAKSTGDTRTSIPKTFDARVAWPNCTTISHVPDQGNCGSSWAVATVNAFADRMCIATNGTFNQLLSVEEATFCCQSCGFGCNGGYPIRAWKNLEGSGVATGGDYGSEEGCEPYRVAPCKSDENGNNNCHRKSLESHQCPRKCYGNRSLDFKEDHRKIQDFYYLTYGDIQKDLQAYGPIQASMRVYDDFLYYESGVYMKTKNATYLGGHAVKLIGWGVENGVDYWLMVNSWSHDWGDNGLFKIRRGTNECGIDDNTTAGVPVI